MTDLHQPTLTEEELKEVYNWVDEFELSRVKVNIARDFADAVLAAEIIHTYFPNLVELHNYYSTNSKQKRVYNWNFLQGSPYTHPDKVLSKIGAKLTKSEIEAVAICAPEAIEVVLLKIRTAIMQVKDSGTRNLTQAAPKRIQQKPKMTQGYRE